MPSNSLQPSLTYRTVQRSSAAQRYAMPGRCANNVSLASRDAGAHDASEVAAGSAAGPLKLK